MKTLYYCLATLFFAAAISISGCKKEKVHGEGAIVTEERNAKDFYKIVLSGSSSAYITKGNNFSVEVKAYENLIPVLETNVRNGTLYIEYKNNTNVSNDNAEVYIIMPSLISLDLNGSGKIISTGEFLGMENFSATVSGSGDIQIDKGATQQYTATISGSGNINSFGLISQQVNAQINGSGNANVHAIKNLIANISGSGNVYYEGDPIVQTQISGSGQVLRK